MKPHIALICGGKSAEHEISCLSALGVFDAIDKDRYQVSLFGITASGRGFVPLSSRADFDSDINGLPIVPESGEAKPLPSGIDLLFPVLHGANGEDGVFQGFAEFMGINYLGSGVLASALAMDKSRAKRIFESVGLKVARGITVTSINGEGNGVGNGVGTAVASGVNDVIDSGFSYPLFVKPVRGGSSRGTSKVKDESELATAISAALQFDARVLIEEAIEGREVECAILQRDGELHASVVGEIRVLGGREFYDYEAKYLDSATEYLIPAPIDQEQSDRIRAAAITAFEAMGCEGLARVDFFLSHDGAITINELNTMPGFTAKSVFPMLWSAGGYDYAKLVAIMIEEALRTPKA